MITVLLVDDHELVRAGLRRLLGDVSGIRVIGEQWGRCHQIGPRKTTSGGLNGCTNAWYGWVGSDPKNGQD